MATFLSALVGAFVSALVVGYLERCRRRAHERRFEEILRGTRALLPSLHQAADFSESLLDQMRVVEGRDPGLDEAVREQRRVIGTYRQALKSLQKAIE